MAQDEIEPYTLLHISQSDYMNYWIIIIIVSTENHHNNDHTILYKAVKFWGKQWLRNYLNGMECVSKFCLFYLRLFPKKIVGNNRKVSQTFANLLTKRSQKWHAPSQTVTLTTGSWRCKRIFVSNKTNLFPCNSRNLPMKTPPKWLN